MRDPYRSCAPDFEVLARTAGNLELFELVARGEISSETAAEVMMVKEERRRYEQGWAGRLLENLAEMLVSDRYRRRFYP